MLLWKEDQSRTCWRLRNPASPTRASLISQLVENPPAMWETWVPSLGWEDALEKGKATHSSILAWRIPWRSPCGPQESDTTEPLSPTPGGGSPGEELSDPGRNSTSFPAQAPLPGISPQQTSTQILVAGLEINPISYSQLTSDKRGKNIQQRKDSLFSKWEIWATACKSMKSAQTLISFTK